MPISSRLRRKLHEILGAEASEDLVTALDEHANRSDLRELRHEMQLGFARIDGRLDAIDAKFAALDTKVAVQISALDVKLTGQISAATAGMDAMLQKGLREQTRFFFLAWAVILASIVGLYAR